MAFWDRLKFPTKDARTVGSWAFNMLRPKVDTFKRDYETIRQPAKKEVSKYSIGKPFKPVDIGRRLIDTAPQTYRDTKFIGSWAFSKLRKTTEDYFKPTEKVRVRDIARELPYTGIKMLKLGTTIREEMSKSGGSLGLSLHNIFADIKDPSGKGRITKFKPSTDAPKIEKAIHQFVFGKEPIESIEKRIIEGEKEVKKFGEERGYYNIEKFSLPLSAVGVGAIIALDFTGFGGGKKEAVKLISKMDDVADISKLLRQAGVAEDLILPTAKKMKTIKSEVQILNALDKIEALQKSTKVSPIKHSDKALETMRRPKATDDIVELEAKLNKKYLAKSDEVNQSMADIWEEIVTAEKGERFRYDPSGFADDVVSKPSTFPDWMPSHLRDRKLFNRVQDDLIKMAGDFKYPKTIREKRLYNAILDEVDARTGVDTFNIRKLITKTYEKPKQITKVIDSSIGRKIPKREVGEKAPKADPLITEARKYAEAGKNKYYYVRNIENKGGYINGKPSLEGTGRFNQQYEPTGEYMNIVSKKGYDNALPNLKKGTVEFKNPLVIETDLSPNWKKELSNKYGGLKRDKLSQAIKEDGYDGIITMAKSGSGKLYPSEVVDLKVLKFFKTIKAKIKPVVKIKAEEGIKGLPTKKEAKILSAKDILDRRRFKVKAVKEHFGLTDNELRKISRKDIRLMDNFEFKKFIDDMRIKAEKLGERKQAMNEIIKQTMDKELDVENLRKAMKLPTMKNMTITDIKKLDEAIKPFQKGDEFLSVRKLEVVDRTELKGIKTWREAREKLAKRLNVPVEELQNIKVSEFDRFRYDTALAERNPFYKMMVEESAGKMLVSEAEYLKLEQKVFTLAKGLKPKGITGRVIPQQKNIRAFMEARPEDRAGIILTETEDKLVKLMTKEFEDVRNYLIQMEAMKMGKENYFTHIRRGVLEAAKEDGVVKAFKEIFEQYKMEEQAFNILDKKTGEILAMDKFFKFAMHRTGEIKPTENTVKAFLTYMKTFKKKQALDEIVPLVDIYAQALTPKGLTKKGVLLHGNLQTFVKEWLNTKKGRHITLMAKQNGKIDGALRTIKMFTSLRDLGLNLPVSIASEVGEQVTTYQLLGKGRFALGKIRQNTKQGKVIIEKYRNLIGKNPWRELVEPSKEAGDRLMEGIFILFRDASTRANKTFLLGSLSKQEFKTGIITPQRLSALRTELGRYRMVQGMKSIIGTTPEGGAYTQYKTWAIPIIRTNIKNLEIIGKKLAGQNKGSSAWKKSILELYREVEITAFAMLAFSLVRDEDDNSFVGQIINKMYRESTTLIQALQPKMFLTAGRTASFITELGENLTSILLWEEYKTKEGLKGVERFKKQITPVVVSQFLKEQKTEYKKAVSEDKEKSDKEKKEFKPTYDKIQKLENEGNTDEMWKIINNLSDNEYEIYKKFLTSTKTKATNKAKEDFYPTFKKIQDLENEGKTKEMWAMINSLTEEEYKIYEKFVKKFD